MVVRLDKATTAFRLIANAKFPFQGKSLNEYLDQGSNLMNLLWEVLVRFRMHNYVLTGDVSQMFLRIAVPERSRKFLRMFCRDTDGKLALCHVWL